MRTPDGFTPREREFLRIVDASPLMIPRERLASLMYGAAKGAELKLNLANLRVIAHRIREKRPQIGLTTVRGEGYIISAMLCPKCGGDGFVKRG